jgi:glycosyltransferase involved in cell wall biosynthesis
MMRIGIDTRELCGQPAGKGQYLRRLIECWLQTPDVFLTLYIRAGTTLPVDLAFAPPRGRAIEVKGWGPLWHRAVAKRLRRDGVDVFFAALSYQSALWNSVPTVTVVHDLAVFKVKGIVHSRRAIIVERLTLKATVRRSAGLIAVSQNTKNDLVHVAKLHPDQVTVIHEAAHLSGRQDPVPREERGPYFLFVGTLEPRKNIGRMLEAYARLPDAIRSRYSLQLAGKPGWGEDYPRLARQLGLGDRVRFLGYVSNDQLVELYRKATAFIYPSLYEGFGLPAIEAMAAGTPVITSNRSSLPEVVGPDGLMCDPTDIECLMRTIAELVEDPSRWQSQSRYLFARSQQFNWRDVSALVLARLRQAASGDQPPMSS